MSTDEGVREGGVRFRENLGKYVVEFTPPGFKWKLWMGTYATVDEGRRACDCARYYCGTISAAQGDGFYFTDSPVLFEELGPLLRPVTAISKNKGFNVKDKGFNVELKKRAKMVIRKVVDAERAALSVEALATGLRNNKRLQCASSEILSSRYCSLYHS